MSEPRMAKWRDLYESTMTASPKQLKEMDPSFFSDHMPAAFHAAGMASSGLAAILGAKLWDMIDSKINAFPDQVRSRILDRIMGSRNPKATAQNFLTAHESVVQEKQSSMDKNIVAMDAEPEGDDANACRSMLPEDSEPNAELERLLDQVKMHPDELGSYDALNDFVNAHREMTDVAVSRFQELMKEIHGGGPHKESVPEHDDQYEDGHETVTSMREARSFHQRMERVRRTALKSID